MTPLRWTGLWRGLGLAGLAAVTALTLLSLPPLPLTPPGEDLTLHVLAWAALAGWFGQLHGRWLVPAALLAWSGVLEAVQPLLGERLAEWPDLAANGVGVALGWPLGRALGPRLLAYVEGRLTALMASIRA